MSESIFKNCEQILQSDAIRIQNEIIDKIHAYDNTLIILPIGSVGKKNDNDTNNDIDIAIKCNTYDKLLDIINTVFDNSIQKIQHSDKIVQVYSIAYPYVSDKDNESHYVQCDFMLIDNIEYAKFRYYCPDYKNGESKYKVYTRILMWNILLNYCNIEELKYLKHYKLVLYPTCVYIIHHGEFHIYTNDVNKIIHLVFTDDIDVKDVLTLENIWKLIHTDKFKSKEHLKDIEIQLFISAYRRPWEELNLNPYDFDFQYWTPEEISKELSEYDDLNELNMYLHNEQLQ